VSNDTDTNDGSSPEPAKSTPNAFAPSCQRPSERFDTDVSIGVHDPSAALKLCGPEYTFRVNDPSGFWNTSESAVESFTTRFDFTGSKLLPSGFLAVFTGAAAGT
jgi:hypothetical protein